jgi:chromosomal replication initiator protein
MPVSKNQDGTDMVDGVVDIPLPGRTLAVAAASCRVGAAARDDPARTRQNAAALAGTRSVPTTKTLTRLDAASSHFLAGPENRLVEVAVRWVVEGQPNGYNPLVLYGSSGTGKSHLARGLAAAWKARDRQPHAEHAEHNRRPRVVCTTAVDFARELADAIETQTVDEFRAKHRGAAMLVVEDLGQLATRKSGKLSAQEELLHTLDALVAEDRWVVVTASVAPWELPGIVPMLQSRLTGGLAVRLAPPGPETRLALLQQLASLRDIELPEPVAQFLADGLSGTARDLAGALLQLAMPEETGTLDLAAARQYLAERRRGHRPSLHEIALATARHFSLRLSDLRSPSRQRALVAARGVAVYLARHLAGQRLEEIGRYFGGRDHTTVMHSYRTTKKLIESDPAIQAAVEQLQTALWKT